MSDYFFYDLNKKMADLAKKQQLAEDAQATPAKPAPNKLMEAAADYSAKKAAAGKDIGKPGKNFSKIAADAGKRYGSAEAGKRVAGAVLNKLRHPTEESIDQGQLKPWKATMKEGGKPDFLDLDKDGNRKEPMKSAARSAKKGLREEGDAESLLAKYSPDMHGRIKNATDDELYSMAQGFGGDQHSRVDHELNMLHKVRHHLSGPEGAGARRVKGVQDRFDKVMHRKTYPVKEDSDAESLLAKYSPDMHGRIKNATDDQLYDMAQGFGGDQPSRVEHELDMLHKVRHHLNGRKTHDAKSLLAKYSPNMHGRIKNATDDQLYNMAQGFGGDQPSRVEHELDMLHKVRHHLNGRKIQETDATPQDVASYKPEVKTVNAPQRKASAPVPPKKSMADKIRDKLTAPRFPSDPGVITDKFPKPSGQPADKKAMPPKNTAMYPPQAIDEPVKEGGVPMTPKQKKFAALAKPFDKISFADKIVGAKKEVDEMLGDVAASAMKKAVRGRNRDMEEASDWSKLHEPFKAGDFDDTPTRRRSSSGGEIDTSKPGSTIHRPVKGNYSGAGHDAGADDEPTGAVGRRKVGAGMGKKIGAKINRGTSKLMTDEGDMPEDMIQPQDSGEYDREGEMAKDDIKTVVRHAQALEKILGDEDNLPEWVQAKLAKIEGMMTAVDDYMQNQKSKGMGSDDQEMDEERTSKRDNRAERAGRRVAKDIEYDEREKDGIHGKRRGSEDSRAERAGKKVTKDIEYDEKKDKKKKEVDETTSSGSVATGGAAPKSSGGHNYGKGIYDSLNRQLENMISESMNINMSMNNDEHGGPKKSLTVTATDEDATMLADLLKMAGMGHDDDHIHDMTGDDSQMLAIQTMGDEEACPSCGSSSCGCDSEEMDEDRWGAEEQPPKLPYDMTVSNDDQVDVTKSDEGGWEWKPKKDGRITVVIPPKSSNKMFPKLDVDEAYGDTDETKNHPDWPTNQEGTDNAGMYSGGIDGPKPGQTTVPVIAGQDDRMGYNGDHELRRMMEIAGLR